MKKLLSVVTLLGALAGAASAAPYVLPSPAGGALTPNDWQPVYAVEGTYTIGDNSEDLDMWGVRGSLNLYSNAGNAIRHQFSLNVAYMDGHTKFHDEGEEVKLEGTLIPITLGYDLNLGLTDSVFFYFGGKAGYAVCDVDCTAYGEDENISDGGFTYSIGAGLKIMASDTIYLKAGYEYGRTFIEAGGEHHYIMSGHTISVGVGWKF